MNKLSLLALVLVAAGAANAASPGEEDYNAQNRNPFTGSMTREQVRQEYAAAMAAGLIPQNSDYSGVAINQQAGSPLDVGAVRDEAVFAARHHATDLA